MDAAHLSRPQADAAALHTVGQLPLGNAAHGHPHRLPAAGYALTRLPLETMCARCHFHCSANHAAAMPAHAWMGLGAALRHGDCCGTGMQPALPGSRAVLVLIAPAYAALWPAGIEEIGVQIEEVRRRA